VKNSPGQRPGIPASYIILRAKIKMGHTIFFLLLEVESKLKGRWQKAKKELQSIKLKTIVKSL
jgi:hypothetical protein